MTEITGLQEALSGQAFIDRSIRYAIERNPGLAKIDKNRITNLAREGALEMSSFEKLARTNSLRVPETPEEAKRVRAIWDLSGVGTYLKEFQDDRWKNIPWVGWTDRRRLNYSAALIRRLTEKITGRSYRSTLGEKLTPDQVAQLRSDIENYGPYLIYNATSEQNEDVEKVLTEQDVSIPKSKIIIPDASTAKTADQMKNVKFPQDLRGGDIIAVVAHAPHLVRILHMLNRYKPLPEGVIVQPHPLPSPPSAGTDYARMEISGLLYYTLITGDAAETSYPYQI